VYDKCVPDWAKNGTTFKKCLLEIRWNPLFSFLFLFSFFGSLAVVLQKKERGQNTRCEYANVGFSKLDLPP
jgi:hypothetical protein